MGQIKFNASNKSASKNVLLTQGGVNDTMCFGLKGGGAMSHLEFEKPRNAESRVNPGNNLLSFRHATAHLLPFAFHPSLEF